MNTHIQKYSSLKMNFQPVLVPEPTIDEIIQILKGKQELYEIQHKVCYTDEALVAAAQLSYEYISNSFLPGKAINLLDAAGSYVHLRHVRVFGHDSLDDYITSLVGKKHEMAKVVGEEDIRDVLSLYGQMKVMPCRNEKNP